MVKLIYLTAFFGVLFCGGLFIFSDIRGTRRFPYLVAAGCFCALFIYSSVLNEYSVARQLQEVVKQRDKEYTIQSEMFKNNSNLSEYDKKRNKYETAIISSCNWNLEELDPIKSGNLKLASDVLKKAVIRRGMAQPLSNFAHKLKENPDKYIGKVFEGEVNLVSYKVLDKKNIVTKLTGNSKVAIYFSLEKQGEKSNEEGVLYLNYNKNRSNELYWITGVFVGVTKGKNGNMLVFVNI